MDITPRMAIIVNAQNPVSGISQAQLREIFSGHITNWKEVGGPDKDIFVAVPDEDTGAYKNFVRQVMKLKEMGYDFKLTAPSGIWMWWNAFPGPFHL